MLAISLMGATPRAIFLALGVICFVLAFLGKRVGRLAGWETLGWLGLALVFFPTLWDAVAAT